MATDAAASCYVCTPCRCGWWSGVCPLCLKTVLSACQLPRLVGRIYPVSQSSLADFFACSWTRAGEVVSLVDEFVVTCRSSEGTLWRRGPISQHGRSRATRVVYRGWAGRFSLTHSLNQSPRSLTQSFTRSLTHSLRVYGFGAVSDGVYGLKLLGVVLSSQKESATFLLLFS